MKQTSARPNYLTKPIQWSFPFDLYFMFEIDIGAIDLVMPPWCNLFEIRPGIGLLCVGQTLGGQTVRDGGVIDGISNFQEVSWCVAVQPDLSPGIPTPKLSFVIGNVVSESLPFLEHASKIDKMPTYHSPSLRSTCDAYSFSGTFEDDDGPIVTLKSSHRMPPKYRKGTFWGQHSSVHDGENYLQVFSWTGSIFEHQQGHRGGILHPHPIFRGIDVTGIGDRSYLQLVAEPGTPISMTLYEPILRSRRAERSSSI